jgi:hypothetical protein
MPIYRRLPKRGFKNRSRIECAVVNLKDLARFEKGQLVDREALKARGLIPSLDVPVKLLAAGQIDFPLTVRLHKASSAALEKLAKAVGSFEISEGLRVSNGYGFSNITKVPELWNRILFTQAMLMGTGWAYTYPRPHRVGIMKNGSTSSRALSWACSTCSPGG